MGTMAANQTKNVCQWYFVLGSKYSMYISKRNLKKLFLDIDRNCT